MIVLLTVPKKKEPINFGSSNSPEESCKSEAIDDTIYKPHLVIAEPKKDGNDLETQQNYENQIIVCMTHSPMFLLGYIEHTSDVLNFRGYQLYSPKDFQMEFLPQDKHYLLISPKVRLSIILIPIELKLKLTFLPPFRISSLQSLEMPMTAWTGCCLERDTRRHSLSPRREKSASLVILSCQSAGDSWIISWKRISTNALETLASASLEHRRSFGR